VIGYPLNTWKRIHVRRPTAGDVWSFGMTALTVSRIFFGYCTNSLYRTYLLGSARVLFVMLVTMAGLHAPGSKGLDVR